MASLSDDRDAFVEIGNQFLDVFLKNTKIHSVKTSE